jgi:hypothetical protein
MMYSTASYMDTGTSEPSFELLSIEVRGDLARRRDTLQRGDLQFAGLAFGPDVVLGYHYRVAGIGYVVDDQCLLSSAQARGASRPTPLHLGCGGPVRVCRDTSSPTTSLSLSSCRDIAPARDGDFGSGRRLKSKSCHIRFAPFLDVVPFHFYANDLGQRTTIRK